MKWNELVMKFHFLMIHFVSIIINGQLLSSCMPYMIRNVYFGVVVYLQRICIRYVLLDHASYWKKSLEANIQKDKEIIVEFKNENDNDF